MSLGSKEVTFSNTSQPLVEGLRYQLLRMGIPTAGKLRKRRMTTKGKDATAQKSTLKARPSATISAFRQSAEIAERVGCKTVTKKNWFTHNHYIFTRDQKQEKIATVPFVYDLKVDSR